MSKGAVLKGWRLHILAPFDSPNKSDVTPGTRRPHSWGHHFPARQHTPFRKGNAWKAPRSC